MENRETLDNILAFAIAEEVAANEFYMELAGKMENPAIAKAFEEFAKEELAHKAKLEAIKQNEIFGDRDVYDLIIDLSCVEIVTSSTISKLLRLHKLQLKRGHRLILCNVSFLSKCVFTFTGFKAVFDFADNENTSLATITHSD